MLPVLFFKVGLHLPAGLRRLLRELRDHGGHDRLRAGAHSIPGALLVPHSGNGIQHIPIVGSTHESGQRRTEQTSVSVTDPESQSSADPGPDPDSNCVELLNFFSFLKFQ